MRYFIFNRIESLSVVSVMHHTYKPCHTGDDWSLVHTSVMQLTQVRGCTVAVLKLSIHMLLQIVAGRGRARGAPSDTDSSAPRTINQNYRTEHSTVLYRSNRSVTKPLYIILYSRSCADRFISWQQWRRSCWGASYRTNINTQDMDSLTFGWNLQLQKITD